MVISNIIIMGVGNGAAIMRGEMLGVELSDGKVALYMGLYRVNKLRFEKYR